MIDLDRQPLDIPCPVCRFSNRIFYREARLRDVIVCRGCKQNIQLDDHMNQCRKARQELQTALDSLEKTMSQLGGTITIKI
jgi:hypothetical protein